jgi:hypothetical protein
VSTTRLHLKRVDFNSNADTRKCRASVYLRLGANEFLSHYEANIDEPPLRVVALATFAAVNQALKDTVSMSIEITLRVAEELHPNFMAKSLFIVIVDVVAGTFSFKPTGAVVADHEDAYRATAAAALDSLNRLIQHLLMLNTF